MSRDHVRLNLNGKMISVSGSEAFMNLSDWLRYKRGLTGTKVVCAEGDCGACTVLKGDPTDLDEKGRMYLRGLNSCIAPVFLFDGCQIISIEAMATDEGLSPCQEKMRSCHGSQCGYCTPGFVMAIAAMHEESGEFSEQRVKNNLTGNLCRCTGYQPIINAAMAVPKANYQLQRARFHDNQTVAELKQIKTTPFSISDESSSVDAPISTKAALKILAEEPATRLLAGATDLGVQRNKGKLGASRFLTLSHIPELYEVTESSGRVQVGARVNLRRFEEFVSSHVPKLSDFMHIFASPQIKESGTLIGNLANASPIGDTLPCLMVLDTEIKIAGPNGERSVAIDAFFKGYKDLDLESGEIIVGVSIEIPNEHEKCEFYKASQRRDLDISCVNAALRMTMKGDAIEAIKIAYGGVGPVPMRLLKTESLAVGKKLTQSVGEQLAVSARSEVNPIADARGSQEFRLKLTENLMKRFFAEHGQGV